MYVSVYGGAMPPLAVVDESGIVIPATATPAK